MPSVLLLLLSLLVVTLGAEALVRGASLLALRVGVSPLFVGLTIVGFGTSSPELSASLAATLQGASGVSVGNVVGSNIFNIAVILGVAAAFRPIRIELAAIRRDVAVAVGAATVPWIALAFDGRLPRVVGSRGGPQGEFRGHGPRSRRDGRDLPRSHGRTVVEA
jgi:cation:H+ antiporter